jgi:hypothetical protein
MTVQRLEFEALLGDIGLRHLTDFLIGCSCLVQALNELSPKQLKRVQARLLEAGESTGSPLPYPTRLVLETVASGLKKQALAIPRINLSSIAKPSEVPDPQFQSEKLFFLRMDSFAQKCDDSQK